MSYNLIYRRSLSRVLIKATEHEVVKLLVLLWVECLATNRLNLSIRNRGIQGVILVYLAERRFTAGELMHKCGERPDVHRL